MAVPAHDERDYEFAVKFNLPIKEVVAGGDVTKEAYTGDGLHVNSDFLDGLNKEDGISAMIKWLEEKEIGTKKVTFRLRDWLFSRQRYWGEPIPIIHWEDGAIEALKEEELPLLLPKSTDIKPSGTGESPLAKISEWVNVVDENGRKGRRETNTMPNWAGSSWYYLRYIDPNNDQVLADPEKLKEWLPVDIYIGGAEHAVLHLLYARFWHKFLYDIGVVSTKEPFQNLFNQGMILGENNEKMSKSKGNVVNPDDIVESHGADTLRMYEMFMGPLDASIAWSNNGLDGSRRFLDRIWRLLTDENGNIAGNIIETDDLAQLEKVYHQTVKKVTENFEELKFNTAISQLMVFINEAYKAEVMPKVFIEGFVKLLSPVAPHIAEELWEKLGHTDTITYETWPAYDEAKLVDDEVEIVIQINGKMKVKLMVPTGTPKEKLEEIAMGDHIIKEQIDGKTIRKVIAVPGKLVNIVAN